MFSKFHSTTCALLFYALLSLLNYLCCLCHPSGDDVLLRVMDWNRMSKDKAIGTVRVDLSSLPAQEQSLPVVSSAGVQASADVCKCVRE